MPNLRSESTALDLSNTNVSTKFMHSNSDKNGMKLEPKPRGRGPRDYQKGAREVLFVLVLGWQSLVSHCWLVIVG